MLNENLALVNWQATIYHGLPGRPVPIPAKTGCYLAFLGRIPRKAGRPTIEIAKRAGYR